MGPYISLKTQSFVLYMACFKAGTFSCTAGWGGWVRQRCHVSCVTGVSNWYWLTVGQGLLPLQQVGVVCFFTVIHFPPSPLSLSFISSTVSSPFLWETTQNVIIPKHNQLYSCPLSLSFISSTVSSPFLWETTQNVIKPQQNQLYSWLIVSNTELALVAQLDESSTGKQEFAGSTPARLALFFPGGGGWVRQRCCVVLPGCPTDFGLQLGKACYPCSR